MAEATFTLRAVDSTKAAFASVQNSLAKLQQSSQTAAGFMKKAFDPRAFGAGFAAALGLSLTSIIDSAISKLTELVMRADNVRKILTESRLESEGILEAGLFAAMDPVRQLETIQGKIIKNAAEIDKLRSNVREEVIALPEGGSMTVQLGSVKEAEELKKLEAMRASLLIANINLIADADKKKVENQAKAFEEMEKLRQSDQDRRISVLNAGLAAEEKNTAEIIKAQSEKSEAVTKEREALEKLAESYRDLNSPSRVFVRQIDEANRLAAEGKISFTEAARAVELLTIEMNKNEASRINTALGDFFGDLDQEALRINESLKKQNQIFDDAGGMIASGFEDAILSGQKLGEVVRSLGQDLVRLVFNQLVTQSLATGIGGAIKSAFGFRAEGGPVNSGSPYIVGEKGPELFVPHSSGSIVPNGAMGSSGGGSGGVTVNYNIAAGVSRSELVPILEQERKRLKAEIPDMVRRGGSYRSAFA